MLVWTLFPPFVAVLRMTQEVDNQLEVRRIRSFAAAQKNKNKNDVPQENYRKSVQHSWTLDFLGRTA